MTRIVSFLMCGLLLSGCLYYDHRWVQRRRAKKERLRKAEAAQVYTRKPSPAAVGAVTRKARIRLYASEAYRKEHFVWEKEMRDVVAQTSATTAHALRLSLEVESARDWDADCDPADLEQCLDELARLDRAQDVDWVVGLVSSSARFTSKFDDLGIAAMPGRHIVLRGFAEAGERERIDREFSDVLSSRREVIYRARRQHKAQLVFLHELAHTLGAPHVRERGRILYPSYAPEAQDYHDDSLLVMKAGMEDRTSKSSVPHEALLGVLEAFEGRAWSKSDKEAMIQHLRNSQGRSLAVGAGQAPSRPVDAAVPVVEHPLVLQGPDSELLGGLSEVERERYREAVAKVLRDDYVSAWKLLTGLMPAHPDCQAVQHMSCGLAMQLGLMEVAQQSCARVAGEGG